MSKTYKTDPYRVKVNSHPRRVADHGYACEYAQRGRRRWLPPHLLGNEGCDIEFAGKHPSARPTGYRHRVGEQEVVDRVTWSGEIIHKIEHYDYWAFARWLTPGCDYRLPDDERYRRWYSTPPKHRDLKNLWYGPSRQEERVKLREAAKDYNTNGDTEHVEFDHQQHRHGISWYWD